MPYVLSIFHQLVLVAAELMLEVPHAPGIIGDAPDIVSAKLVEEGGYVPAFVKHPPWTADYPAFLHPLAVVHPVRSLRNLTFREDEKELDVHVLREEECCGTYVIFRGKVDSDIALLPGKITLVKRAVAQSDILVREPHLRGINPEIEVLGLETDDVAAAAYLCFVEGRAHVVPAE